MKFSALLRKTFERSVDKRIQRMVGLERTNWNTGVNEH
jgi:hypothetical protein